MMQPIFLLLSILLNLSLFVNQNNDTANLTIKVTHIPNEMGKVYLFLYASKDDYPYNSFQYMGKPAKKGELVFVMENLPIQEYAIMAYHDENNNEVLDSYFFSLPKEYYGFSNDARSLFGPPSFESSKFMLHKDDMTVSFKVQ